MNSNCSDKIYVQIAGNFKSGTSLLSSLFDGHEGVCSLYRETGFTGYMYPYLRDGGIFTDSERREGFLYRHHRHKILQDGLEKVKKQFAALAGENTGFTDLYWALMRAHYRVFEDRELDKVTHWADKSPLSHVFANDVLTKFPNAKIIHMIREPKNNLASIWTKLEKKQRSWKQKEAILYRYHRLSSQSLSLATHNQNRLGEERYKVIRFEDLCSQPETVLKDICSFINLDYSKKLLVPTQGERLYQGNNHEGERFSSISNVNIDRWKERLPDYPAALMECQPDENFDTFGYQKYFGSATVTRAKWRHRMMTTLIDNQTLKGNIGGYPLDSVFLKNDGSPEK